MPLYQVVLLLIFIWFVLLPIGCFGVKLMIGGACDLAGRGGEGSGDDPHSGRAS